MKVSIQQQLKPKTLWLYPAKQSSEKSPHLRGHIVFESIDKWLGVRGYNQKDGKITTYLDVPTGKTIDVRGEDYFETKYTGSTINFFPNLNANENHAFDAKVSFEGAEYTLRGYNSVNERDGTKYLSGTVYSANQIEDDSEFEKIAEQAESSQTNPEDEEVDF